MIFFCGSVSRRVDTLPIFIQTAVRVCLIHNNNNNNEGRKNVERSGKQRNHRKPTTNVDRNCFRRSCLHGDGSRFEIVGKFLLKLRASSSCVSVRFNCFLRFPQYQSNLSSDERDSAFRNVRPLFGTTGERVRFAIIHSNAVSRRCGVFFSTRDTKGENMFQGVTTAICGFVVGFIVATCVIEFATDAAVREIADQVATRTQEINRERIVERISQEVTANGKVNR